MKFIIALPDLNMEAKKGNEIRFVKGNYAGKTGWINKAKKKTKGDEQRYVIVEMGDGTELATKASKYSIRKPHEEPRTYEEAALQQHFDIEKTMVKLASMFAECAVYDSKGAAKVFDKEVRRAIKEIRGKGPKARFRNVEFYDHQAEEAETVPIHEDETVPEAYGGPREQDGSTYGSL